MSANKDYEGADLMGIPKKRLCALLVTVILFFVLFITMEIERDSRRKAEGLVYLDMHNMELLGRCLEMYIMDYGGYFPTVKNPWDLNEVLMPKYVGNDKIFICPIREKSASSKEPMVSGYHFNLKLCGKRIDSVEDGTIIIYEPWDNEDHPPRFFYVINLYGSLIPQSSNSPIIIKSNK